MWDLECFGHVRGWWGGYIQSFRADAPSFQTLSFQRFVMFVVYVNVPWCHGGWQHPFNQVSRQKIYLSDKISLSFQGHRFCCWQCSIKEPEKPRMVPYWRVSTIFTLSPLVPNVKKTEITEKLSAVFMWEADKDYQAAELIAGNIRVCNDSAERGSRVKLSSDFLQSSKEKQTLQTILQVVKNSRTSHPDQHR